jgi:hypothetical protein
MKRMSFTLLVVIACMLYCSGMSFGQAKFDNGKSPDAPVTNEVKNVPQANADGEMPTAQGFRRLTLRERRDLGITWANVFSKTKELYKDGQISADMSRAEIAAMVFCDIAADNPKAFSDPTVDWDSIIAFIETLLPLILTLIGLFS